MSPDPVTSYLQRIRTETLDEVAGFAPEASGLSIAQIAASGWRLHEALSTPVAVLDAAALDHNLRKMATWCAERGVLLQPHGKTTMAPQLFARQVAAGTYGLTAATPAQVRMMRRAGFGRIQLANELTQPREAAWIAQEISRDDGFEFCCWVDSAAGVGILEAAAAPYGVALDVLIEIGSPGGRTGSRTASDQADVIAEIARSPHVRLVGVAGYEGAVAGDRSPSSLQTVREYLRRMRSVAADLLAAGRFDGDGPWTLTAGGSMFFDLVVAELAAGEHPDAFQIVLRSGCYIAHDHGLFAANPPLAGAEAALRPALTVWGTVVSMQDGQAFLDVGRRDISYDQSLPVPLRRHRPGHGDVGLIDASVTALNDQHAFVRVGPGSDVQVGDRIQLGISHPCTTFDKHRVLPVLDDAGVIIDVVRTFF